MKSRNDFTPDEKGQKMWIEYLRTYFSAMAMQGILARYNGKLFFTARISSDAVSFADALIEELNLNKTEQK